MVLLPRAASANSISALLICALGEFRVAFIGSGVSMPVRVSGMNFFCRIIGLTPTCFRCWKRICMGLLRRLLSPFMSTGNFLDARSPAINRAVVPLFPHSSMLSGSCRASIPAPSIVHCCFIFFITTPSLCRHFIVAIVSLLSSNL